MWNEVTVEEFLELLDLQYEEMTPTEKQLESIAIVTGDDYDDLDEKDLDGLLKTFNWLQTEPKYSGELPRFELVSYGTLISLLKFTTTKPPLQNIDKICAVILGYDDFQTKCNQIKGDYLPKYYAIVDGWLKYWAKTQENYDGILLGGDDEEFENEEPEQDEIVQSRWNWESTVWHLANGDITKANDILDLPHLMVLNWITMVQDLKLNQPTRTAADN